MLLTKHVTAAEALNIPANHVVIVLPAEKLGEQAKTKGGKQYRPLEGGFQRFGTVPCENNPKIRVSASAIVVNPLDYVGADTKKGKNTLTL
jgi:hypothetical protein